VNPQFVCFTGGLGPVRGRVAPCAPESVYTAFRHVLRREEEKMSVEPVTRIKARKLLASMEASRSHHVSRLTWLDLILGDYAQTEVAMHYFWIADHTCMRAIQSTRMLRTRGCRLSLSRPRRSTG
jgi:hypothetical protein